MVRAQVEFYFSDYNLKRDKRLLEKICKEPQRGYLSVEDVLALSRVRQLVSSANALYSALESSPFIDLILPEKEQELRNQMKAEKEKEAEQRQNPMNDKADDDQKEDIDSKRKIDDKEGGGDGDDDDDDESVQFHPEFVGRARFSPPTEKQFPFRRYVLFH